MKKQHEGYITLFDKKSLCVESRPYHSFEERIGIINDWKRYYRNIGHFYQIDFVEPEESNLKKHHYDLYMPKLPERI